MLAFILAIAVGLASVFFFLSAFFAPKLHRKDDFLWSGVGFFYALVLWLCATRITGGVLLGQGAAVVLILSFAWQTIKLRAVLANPEAIAPNSTFSLLDWIGGGLSRPKAAVKPAKTSSKVSTPQPETPAPVPETVVEPVKTVIPETEAAIAAQTEELTEDIQESASETAPASVMETASETPIAPVPETAPQTTPKPTVAPKAKKPGFFSGLFGKKSTAPKTNIAPTSSVNANLTAALDAVESSEEEDWDEPEVVPQPEVIVESVTIEVTEVLRVEAEEDPLDDLLEDDPAEETELEQTADSDSENAESESSVVTSISGLSDMLDTYDEDIEEFAPYLGGQETATALESEPSPGLSTPDEDGTPETSTSEVSAD